MKKLVMFFAFSFCLLSAAAFGRFLVSMRTAAGFPAPPTGDYLNIAIIASVAALAVILLLLLMKRRKGRR